MSFEGNRIEEDPKIELRTGSKEEMFATASRLISKYSWGMDYPISPLHEIRQAEYSTGAYIADTLVGFAGVSRHASPDGRDNGELWFGYAVVVPEWRGRGIFRMLYNTCMRYMEASSGRILCCTDNPMVESFILKHGWRMIRKAQDESGAACIVFEYDRVSRSSELQVGTYYQN